MTVKQSGNMNIQVNIQIIELISITMIHRLNCVRINYNLHESFKLLFH